MHQQEDDVGEEGGRKKLKGEREREKVNPWD